MIVECGKCESLDSYIYRKGKRNKKLGDYVKEDEGMSSPEVNDIGVKRMEKSTVRSRKVRKDQLKKSKVTGLPKSERKQNGVNSTQSLRGPLPSHVTFTDCLALAFINTLGIFNRPTFALFTVAPFLYWCYSMRSDMFLLFGRISLFVVSSLLCTAVFCGFDTMYYKECSVTDIISRHNLMEELVFTPWNFVKYNSVSSNLELHGRHPFYLHFLVNLPLLFGPMTLLLYYGCLSVIKDFFSNLRLCSSILQGTKTKEERLDSSADALNFHKLLVIIFIITPVTLLSIFPHQEPRFLTPLLPVVILFTLYTSSVSGESFIFINVLFNVILSVVFGVLHQGGVIPCLFKLNELTSMNEMSHYNTTVLFSNTYMPPRHILLQKETSGVTILDLKGSNSEIIEEAILKIEQKWEDDHYGQKINELLLVMPGTVLQNFKKEIKSKLNFNVIEQFYFHLTLEDPPVFTHKAAIDQMSLFLLKVSTNNWWKTGKTWLSHYHTMPHFHAWKINSYGKHCEKRRNCL